MALASSVWAYRIGKDGRIFLLNFSMFKWQKRIFVDIVNLLFEKMLKKKISIYFQTSAKKMKSKTTLELAAICGRCTFSNLFSPSKKENVKMIFPSPHLIHTHTVSGSPNNHTWIFLFSNKQQKKHFYFPSRAPTFFLSLFAFPSLSDFEVGKVCMRKLKSFDDSPRILLVVLWFSCSEKFVNWNLSFNGLMVTLIISLKKEDYQRSIIHIRKNHWNRISG